MALFASLLVNAVVAAAPANPLPWYSFDDYPMVAFQKQWKGAATFELLVDPQGRPTDCTITRSSGYADLDRETCFIAMHRARFTPARGPDGTPVYGAYRSMVKWHRPDQDSLQVEPGPDLEVTVASLPPGTEQPPAVKLAYFVDASGQPSSCTVLPESKVQSSTLVQVACQQVLAKAGPPPTQRPIVKTAAVLFSTKE
jgi:TonB family protein